MTVSTADELFEHCLGDGCPSQTILDTGVLSAAWVDRYIELVQDFSAKFRGKDMWPAKGVAAIHFTSFYLNLRYDAWCSFEGGHPIPDTERELARLRTPGEVFLLSAGQGERLAKLETP